jgi:hypothetical protein
VKKQISRVKKEAKRASAFSWSSSAGKFKKQAVVDGIYP